VREKILACKALWTEDEAEFHGELVDFGPSWAWPKPVQQPHPPILIGASPTPLHFRHIVEYGDVWMPIEGRFEIEESWQRLRKEAEAAGRDPATLSLGVFGAKPDAAHLAQLRDLGADYIALGVPPLDRDAALARMERYAPLVAEFNG
jgi:alkanesulfonate monooxygenase SsuD/methylene tetrahydromethanopterin reductase-like flavin-dependent oxidoreductase (luciferase family)